VKNAHNKHTHSKLHLFSKTLIILERVILKNGSLSKYSRLPMARAEESQAEDVIIPLSNCQGTFSDLISSSNIK